MILDHPMIHNRSRSYLVYSLLAWNEFTLPPIRRSVGECSYLRKAGETIIKRSVIGKWKLLWKKSTLLVLPDSERSLRGSPPVATILLNSNLLGSLIWIDFGKSHLQNAIFYLSFDILSLSAKISRKWGNSAMPWFPRVKEEFLITCYNVAHAQPNPLGQGFPW